MKGFSLEDKALTSLQIMEALMVKRFYRLCNVQPDLDILPVTKVNSRNRGLH